MKKIRVGVLMGGTSNEREVSLLSGEQVIRNLSRDLYDVSKIEITKDGKCLFDNKKFLTVLPGNDLEDRFDIIFIALHGAFGEDGKVQAILDTLQIPYTGSGMLASALGMDKAKTAELLISHNIRMPKSIFLQKNEKIIPTLKFPCVVKPNASGSSVGVSIVKEKIKFRTALHKAFKEDQTVLVQEYIEGRELTCAIMGNSKDNNLIALPPIEIVSPGTFFDYNAKYLSKKTQEICPAPIDKKGSSELYRLSKKIHLALGCDGLTRSDFILSKKDNRLYFLEINTIPGLTEASLCPKAAKAADISFPEFLDKQIQLALWK
ncbi:MAG: D-alanine--D-alanine ligase [Parcubacteria group bacterium]|nr:D-alanine--D-alanine ligase [Parcubacteria group bacterium]